MKIGGFQKLSLLNYPGKTACTVFTSGCNFRCPYCHNSGLAEEKEPEITPELVLDHLRKRRGILEGICISGGEPLIHRDILQFFEQIKRLGYAIKLDTNGSNPDLLKEAIKSGLVDYAAMDIKNTAEKYPMTAGCAVSFPESIGESAEFLKRGTVPYEFRTTVVNEFHDAEDIRKIAGFLAGASVWYLQPFQDVPEVPVKGLHAPDPEKMKEYGSIANRFVKTMIRN